MNPAQAAQHATMLQARVLTEVVKQLTPEQATAAATAVRELATEAESDADRKFLETAAGALAELGG